MGDSKFKEEKMKKKNKTNAIQKTHLLDRNFLYFVKDLKYYIRNENVDGSAADIEEVVYRVYAEISKELKRGRFKKIR